MDGGFPKDNPYVTGKYGPVTDEITATDLKVIGEIPKDFGGVYLRNGPNPRYTPKDRAHWFDGDGMLHALHFENGKATYRNRYVRTADFEDETQAGEPVYPGLMQPFNKKRPMKPLKDTANTDVKFHAGHALAMWYVSGTPYKVHPITLETMGPETFNGKLQRNISAHSKNDPHTGEFMFFDYGVQKPWMTYGVVDKHGEMTNFTEIELPGPRLPHDMAVTENYSIVMDLPLFLTDEALRTGKWQISFHDDMPARFGVIPRHGKGSDVRWFEAEPCYVYHVSNAWEEGDEIVMDGFRVVDPCPKADPRDGELARMLAFLRPTYYAYRWRFNLKTGQTKEQLLDNRNAEFPTINWNYMGRKTRYSYAATLESAPTLLFDGLIKYDRETNSTIEHRFGKGKYGSEAPFAPRHNPKSEDDGYSVTFVQNEVDGTSEMLLIDAQNFAAPPVARIQLPQRVPIGFHACWITEEELKTVA